MQTYRPDIAGLRAVAVLAVIVFHAFPHRLCGGFAGVDVFFVISGYLISGILLREARTERIDFFAFYRKRIDRIFPSLACVLFATLAVGWIALFPKEFHQLGADAASGATFSANFSLLGEAGYFDRNAATKPLLHLWSLAIEEQFYIVWPLFIWAIARLRARATIWLAGFSALSFACNLLFAVHAPVEDFYLPATRFWELSLGGLLAAYELEFGVVISAGRRQDVLAVGGCLALVVASLTLTSEHFPGLQALIPVAGAVALIAAGARATPNRIVLAMPAMRWIGGISYPLYLWHWPLLSFARILEGETPSIALRFAVLAIALAAAVLTHYLIEDPMRFGPHRRLKTAVALVSMLCAAGLGQYIFLERGLAVRSIAALNPALATAAAGGAGPYAAGDCDLPAARRPRVDGCLRDTREAPRFALIGDSKAGALAPGIFRTSRAGGRWIYLGNNDGKGRYMSTTLLSPAFPREYPLTREMLDVIEAHPSIRAVVIANARRNLYRLDGDVVNAFDRTVSELTARGLRVYLVVDNPTLGNPEDCVGRITTLPALNRALKLPARPGDCTITYRDFVRITAPYRAMLATVRARHAAAVAVIETADIYCAIRIDRCVMFRNGRLMYGYTDHPSDYAAGFVGARVNATLRKIRAAPH